MTQEIEIIIDEPITLTLGTQQALPDSVVLDDNYVHTDNNYTDEDKDKVANALTSETDPTVPSWAKQPLKPSYNKSEIGLGDVDNTSDANKPVSTATQTALNNKLNSSAVSLSAGQVGFGSGSNTIGGSNDFYWGNTNKRLGIGTTTPAQQLEITGNFRLPQTTFANSNSGVIYKDGDRFLHDFNYGNNGTVTTTGQNLFLGKNAGNFTMGSTAAQVYQSSYNVGIGNNVLQSNTAGYSNVAVGLGALQLNTTGYYIVAIGLSAGSYIANGTTANQTSTYSVYIGSNTKASLNGNTNEIVIGYNATGNGSNSVTLGNDNILKTILKGNVGIGTTTPAQQLHVVGNGIFTGTLKIGAYTLPNTDGTANQMLRTNGSGVVSWQNSYPIEVINSSNLFSRGLSGTGSGVTSADYSIFFGNYAGYSATNASYSNFFGASAGHSATNANNSNFFGASAGYAATNAAYSNFFGYYAGHSATNAYYSNLFGYQAGKTFTGNNIGSNNIIIGTNISLGDAVANSMNIGGVLFGTGFNSDTSGNPKIAPVAGGKVGVGEVAPKERLEVDGVVLSRFKTMSADPTTSDIASGYFMAVKNTSTGKLHLWANDGGTMKKIEFT